MTSSSAAIDNFLAGKTSVADITGDPFRSTVKYRFGVNLEQEITPHWRGFTRWGWNEGQHESFAYTEVDETVQLGADYSAEKWRRKLDKAGAVFVSNGISADHQRYLALGGATASCWEMPGYSTGAKTLLSSCQDMASAISKMLDIDVRGFIIAAALRRLKACPERSRRGANQQRRMRHA